MASFDIPGDSVHFPCDLISQVGVSRLCTSIYHVSPLKYSKLFFVLLFPRKMEADIIYTLCVIDIRFL